MKNYFFYSLLIASCFNFSSKANEQVDVNIPVSLMGNFKSVSTSDSPSDLITSSGTWPPNQEETKHALKLAKSYLKLNQSKLYKQLNSYHLQIYGIGQRKKKDLHLNFYCGSSKVNHYMMAFDGEDCYFRFNLNLNNGKITLFSKNGAA